MKSQKLIIDYLRQQILYAKSIISSLEFELSREVEEEGGYLFKNASEFATLIMRLLSILSSNLELNYHRELMELEQSGKLSKSQLDDIQRRIGQKINDAFQVAVALTPLIKFVNGAHAVANPWGMVAQIDRLCRDLNPEARVIIRPRWQYNYTYFSILDELWQASRFASFNALEIKYAMTKLINESPFFFSLAFPPTTRLNLLEMAIWAHELGHFTDNFEGRKKAKSNRKSGIQISHLSQDLAEGLILEIPPKLVKQMLLNTAIDEPPTDVDAQEKINEPIAILTKSWAGEIFADLFSVRLFGPAAIFALINFVEPLLRDLDSTSDPAYPTLRIRLRIVLRQFELWIQSDPAVKKIYTTGKNSSLKLLKVEIDRLKQIALSPAGPLNIPYSSVPEIYLDTFYSYILNNIDKVIRPFNDAIKRIIEERPNSFLKPSDLLNLQEGFSNLADDLPPSSLGNIANKSVTKSSRRKLPLLINTGWIYWLARRKEILDETSELFQYEKLQAEFDRINSLLLRAVEEHEAYEWFQENSRFGEMDSASYDFPYKSIKVSKGRFSTPTKSIWDRNKILSKMAQRKLVIRPLLHPETQIGDSLIYLRLGNEFIISRRNTLTKVDPIEAPSDFGIIPDQDKYFLPFGKPFVLHPMQFVLAHTLEYLATPGDCAGWVTNRIEWVKLGLIATSGQDLPPGFKGQVILELTNLGNAPILLYPGSRICQITLLSR